MVKINMDRAAVRRTFGEFALIFCDWCDRSEARRIDGLALPSSVMPCLEDAQFNLTESPLLGCYVIECGKPAADVILRMTNGRLPA